MKVEGRLNGINLSRDESIQVDSSDNRTDKNRQEEERVIRELKKRDSEVKTHEIAHATAAGNLLVSGPNYTYQTGPDGYRYAIGGNVQIDTSPVPGEPKKTIEKAERMKRAALAPGNPSSADFNVANAAAKLKIQAQEELSKQSISPVIQSGGKLVLKTEDAPVFYDKTGKTAPQAIESRFSVSV